MDYPLPTCLCLQHAFKKNNVSKQNITSNLPQKLADISKFFIYCVTDLFQLGTNRYCVVLALTSLSVLFLALTSLPVLF